MWAGVVIGLAVCAHVPAHAQAPAPGLTDAVAGVTVFHQVTPSVAVSGAVPPASMAALAARGIKTIVIVRLPGEPGYDAAATEAAARAAGLEWVAAPFSPEAPDPLAVDRVLEALARPGAGSAVIACRTGQRAALMLYAKRVVTDGWDEPRAMQEAESLGLVRDDLKAFGRSYVAARTRKTP